MSILDEIHFDHNHTFVTVKLSLDFLTHDYDGVEQSPEEQHAYWQIEIDYHWKSIVKYLTDYGLDIVASSVGIHTQGKNEKPHAHFHYLVKIIGGSAKKNGVKPSNPSGDRKRWSQKNHELGFVDINTNVEFKYQDLNERKNYHADMLSYPLKEGQPALNRSYYTYNNMIMLDEMYNALLEHGKALFAAAQAEKSRKEKLAEGSYSVMTDILTIAQMALSREEFDTYEGMRRYLDDRYIKKLPLNQYPRPNDYKVHCQKIGVYLGLLRYSDL